MQMDEEQQEETRKLVVKIANACREHDALCAMFALEASLQASIEHFGTVVIGDLFHECMQDFKAKAAFLLAAEMAEMEPTPKNQVN
jgi:hypothetical protein